MFDKILIANRGEIACRIIHTAKLMGIKTVAVYSEADVDAKHVELADEAVLIGPAAASQSYLVGTRIIDAALQTGAQAIHPGYGFLSENAGFLKAVEAAGLVFIGPGLQAITSMGDKIESKKLAAIAGVSTVPGYVGEIADDKEALKISREIGYPVMIKASAGGGGKGMRIARSDAEVKDGFNASRNEAKSSFGDDRIFIEKYIEEPRHIEIQVLGDKHGNIVHLFERECSIQRRHQKVIEEAPSPFLDEATRAAMGAQAVALSKAVDYYSAGTVEFIVDRDKNFYFLEMNTRLQVEHPVTEKITGLDLVEQMIRVAYGEKLAFTQDDLEINGWAMETRVYAEDPYRNFLPSIGRLSRYQPPEEGRHVRVDTGVYEGAEISMFYDPMIAKLITHADTREEAIAVMRIALDQYYIRGISHNIPFLSAIMAHPRFQEGRLSTNFIADEYKDGFQGGTMSDEVRETFIAVAAFMHVVETSRASMLSGGNAVVAPQGRAWRVHMDDAFTEVTVLASEHGAHVIMGHKSLDLASKWVPGQPVFKGFVAGKRVSVEIDRLPMGYLLTADGVAKEMNVMSPRQAELYMHMPEKIVPDTSNLLLCPMPGLMVAVNVVEGDTISAGQSLAIVEAMKMENILRAERDCVVKSIKVKAGDSLTVDQVIMEFA